MANFSDSHRRLFRSAAMAIGAVAIVLVVLSLLGTTGLPVFIPLLLLISAVGLLLMSAGGA